MYSNSQTYQNRISAVRAKLPEWGVEGLLINSPTNRRWLSGFTGSFGMIIITADRAMLGTDFRYWNRIASEAPDFELIKLEGGTEKRVAQLLTESAVSSLALEGLMSLSEFKMLKELDGPAIQYKILDETVEPLRDVKTAAEIEAIRAAAAITDQAMSAVNEIVKPGMSEKQLAWELEKMMREAGADSLAFSTIIASGPNGANPHHGVSDRKFQVGDAITVDMGASLNGYQSDLTRTFYLGNEPDEKFWEIYTHVHEAQKRALNALKAGAIGNEVDAQARDYIKEAGYGDNFGHGLGHGLGLDVHENPRLSNSTSENPPLPAGAVVTVEPGIYIPGWGGVRIEDLILITESGFDYLSHCSKNPIIPV